MISPQFYSSPHEISIATLSLFLDMNEKKWMIKGFFDEIHAYTRHYFLR
jgi:hypothetical protein